MPELVVLTEQLLAPVPGGTGRYTAELARALAGTSPPDWTVTGVTARHADLGPARIDGVGGPRALPLPRRGLVLAWERGLPLWPGGDVVFAPTPLAPAAAKRGRVLVVAVHDAVPFTHPETLTVRGAGWHRAMIRRAAERAHAIVVPTQAVADDLAVHAPGPAQVHVVGHGVSPALRDAPDPATQAGTAARLCLPPRYILVIGTVEPRKGLDTLVAALARPEAPDLPLVVVGPPGWGEVDLAALAARHGLPADRVRALGRLSDADLAVVLHRAAVLAAPSRSEGFGLPVLEAMAAGVPVVHSDAPALVEVAGGAGLTVPRDSPSALAEGLRSVAGSPRQAAWLTERGHRRATQFTWEKAAESVWRLHTALHAGKAG